MGYTNLIRQQVDAAFKAAGDLADTVTFVTSNVSFNFATGEPTISESGNYTLKCVKGKRTRPPGESQKLDILLPGVNYGYLNTCEKAYIGGVLWNVEKFESDNFLTKVYLREN